jgi:hypothetical protein
MGPRSFWRRLLVIGGIDTSSRLVEFAGFNDCSAPAAGDSGKYRELCGYGSKHIKRCCDHCSYSPDWC